MAAKKASRKGLLPQSRALRHLEELGWVVGACETKIGFKSKDWAGFADILAVFPENTDVKLIQVTDDTNFSKRVAKCFLNKCAQRIINTMPIVAIEVWGYRNDAYSCQWPKAKLSAYYRPYRVQHLVPASLRNFLLTHPAG